MKIHLFVFNPYMENTYIYFDELTKEAAIIDPGCFSQREFEEIDRFLNSNKLILKYILVTHGHIDHILGVNYFRKKFGISAYMHNGDKFLVEHILEYAESFGFLLKEIPDINMEITSGLNLKLGNTSLEFLHTPGHSPGGVCIIDRNNKNIFCGDLIFRDSIGRTDLPKSDFNTLMNSIKKVLFTCCNDDFKLYPGHMESTTIEQEKNHNQFLI